MYNLWGGGGWGGITSLTISCTYNPSQFESQVEIKRDVEFRHFSQHHIEIWSKMAYSVC